MIFDRIRNSRSLKLAVLFSFAAAAPLQGLPRENPEITELRALAATYAKQGPLMSRSSFERFSDLIKKVGDEPAAVSALNAAGFCAHGSGGSSGGTAGGGIAATCPAQRRRMAKGDHSHLLAINHWV